MEGSIASFNERSQKNLWLDFDVIECSPQNVVLHCGIDLTIEPEIELYFEEIFFASLLMAWKTDTSRKVLEILTGNSAREINLQYQVEEGYEIFAFHPDYLPPGGRCLIGAKKFSWRMLDSTYLSRLQNK